ncbi:MAG TPA: DUF4332 domain-containing protein [Blastocatellia bacterium]|nr:DUF4332 domain-containing protein [Blastocatellia bacterium]
MAKIIEVEGVGEAYAQKLIQIGIETTSDLLEQGASPKGRKDISDKTGITEKLVLRWVNHVDLFRIKGVGEEYADLLEASGVDTVPELAQRKAENLVQKLAAANEERKRVRQLPSLAQVTAWIEEAKTLPRVITY